MLNLNVPAPVVAMSPMFRLPTTLPFVLSSMATPRPLAGAGVTARLDRIKCPVFGLYASPRSVEPAVSQVPLAAGMAQMGVIMLATMNDHVLVRRLEPLSVKARVT